MPIFKRDLSSMMQCYPLYTNISCCTWTKVEKSTCILISRDKEISWLEAVGLATGPSVSRLPCLCLYSAFVSDRLSSGFSGRAPSVRRRAPRVPRNESLSDYRAVLATRSQASCVTGLTTRVDRARVVRIHRVTVKDTTSIARNRFLTRYPSRPRRNRACAIARRIELNRNI